MTIAISNFVRRQSPSSEFSHWTCSDEELLRLVNDNFSKGEQGYRDGVWLVPVPPAGFFSGMVQLKEGDSLEGEYKARKEGETPRKSTYCTHRNKLPALGVQIVLYRHDVLAENNEQSCDAEWEIISVNANPCEGKMPIPVGALMANHFQLSGGTATHMTDAEFVKQLRESVLFYADKAHCAPAGRPTRDEIVKMLSDVVELSTTPDDPVIIQAKNFLLQL